MAETAEIKQISDFRDTAPLPSSDKIPVQDRTEQPGGGGGPMDSKYVTKEELKTLMDFYPERGGPTLNHEYATKQELQILQAKIEGKIDTLGVKIDSKFENVDSSISDLKSSIPDKISLAIHDQFEKRDHDRKETNHFIIGTWVIGGLSLVVSIVSIIVTIVR